MENPKDVTIYDIAKNLNVSPSTVSRALNDDPNVSKKTRKKVFETAVRMGYRINLFAKNLRQQQSLTIGVIVYELNSSFMTLVLSGIENVANEAGYGIIIMDSAQSAAREVANAQSLFHRRVDGVIAFPGPDTKALDHFKPFTDRNIPLIFLDHAGGVQESTCVVIDNAMCGQMAARHLIGQGCRRIAHLTSTLQHDIYALRYKGFRAALMENDLSFDESLLITAPPTEEDSELAAKKLMSLRPMPDGLFVTNDLAAAVCIRTFLDQGIRVPQDIAVVGFNNDVIGKLIKPTLTTINYPGREMGETAARNLMNHLKGVGNMNSISILTVRADLIIRQSSLKKG
ncbi:MAG: LacI family DNA-binding transcriptional regulator [Chitinophagaceae bacterium]|nr:LacI family DNA-binding transcriptional regulator [Chitinophagaceae bacterium]